MKVLSDALAYVEFAKEDDWTFRDYEPAPVAKYLRQFPIDLDILVMVGTIVEEVPFPAWCDNEDDRVRVKSALDVRFREAAANLGVKFVLFMQTLRVAITGREHGMDMYDALLLLGQDRILHRLLFAIEEFIISPNWQAEERIGVGSVFSLLCKAMNAWKGKKDMARTNHNDATASAPQGTQGQIAEDKIRELAYYKWEEAGRPPGDGRQFWEEAERELAKKAKK